mgnify:FL=1
MPETEFLSYEDFNLQFYQNISHLSKFLLVEQMEANLAFQQNKDFKTESFSSDEEKVSIKLTAKQ